MRFSIQTQATDHEHGAIPGVVPLDRRQMRALQGGSPRSACKSVGGTYHSFSDSDGNYYQTCNLGDGKLAVWLNY